MGDLCVRAILSFNRFSAPENHSLKDKFPESVLQILISLAPNLYKSDVKDSISPPSIWETTLSSSRFSSYRRMYLAEQLSSIDFRTSIYQARQTTYINWRFFLIMLFSCDILKIIFTFFNRIFYAL